MELPTYITLEEAARRYQISRETLTRMIESGKIRAVQIDGRVAVATIDVALIFIQDKCPDNLDLVSINEAAKRLNLHQGTVWLWYKRGWLPALGRGPNRAIYVSFRRAEKLASMRAERGKRGRRLIPKNMEHLLE